MTKASDIIRDNDLTIEEFINMFFSGEIYFICDDDIDFDIEI